MGTKATASAATLVVSIALSGCANLNLNHPFGHLFPPETPSPGDVVASWAAINTAFNTGQGTTLSPAAYVALGYRFVDTQCHQFFDHLTNAQRIFDLAHKETILTIGTASSVLALAKNTAQTLAYVAAGGAFVTGTLDNTEDFVLLTRYVSQLNTILQRDQDAFVQQKTPDSFTDTSDLGKIRAVKAVEDYARLCTVENLERIIGVSLNDKAAEAQAIDLTKLENQIAFDLAINTPLTEDDLKILKQLLDGDPAKRAGLVAGKDKFYNDGRYWWASQTSAHKAGELTPLGRMMQAILDTLLP